MLEGATLYFDGPDIFKVALKSNHAVEVELQSGDYLHLVVAEDGQVMRHRMTIRGQVHVFLYIAKQTAQPPESLQNECIRDHRRVR